MARLGVCSWSLQPRDPADLIQKTRETGLKFLQCALDPIRESPRIWARLADEVGAAGMEIISGMFGTIGEDYSTLESIRRTGGIVPDQTWTENWENIQATASLSRQMGLKLVSFHAGFLPHLESDPAYEKLLHRLRLVADLFAEAEINLALETGQESAAVLNLFLQKLGRQNVGVNFDPANMILYDKGDPVAALRLLLPKVQQCHLKDARKTQTPGTWGEEVVVGTGEVNWVAFMEVLQNFHGDLVIEREAGSERVRDVQLGRTFIEPFLRKLA